MGGGSAVSRDVDAKWAKGCCMTGQNHGKGVEGASYRQMGRDAYLAPHKLDPTGETRKEYKDSDQQLDHQMFGSWLGIQASRTSQHGEKGKSKGGLPVIDPIKVAGNTPIQEDDNETLEP